MEIEKRYIDINDLETREENDKFIIEGYPIVYNQYAYFSRTHREIIEPGASTEALKKEIWLVYSHDTSRPLARQANGTLEYWEDKKGVKIRAVMNKTERARQTYEEIKSGLLDKMSFQFRAGEAIYEETKEGEDIITTRRIKSFELIREFSPVAFPAYEQTQLNSRCIELMTEESGAPDSDGPSTDEERERYLEEKKRKLRYYDLKHKEKTA